MRDAERDGKGSHIDMKGVDAAPPTQMSLWSLVLAATDGAPEKKDSNGWMKDLTAEQRAKLKSDLAHLDKLSKKEQEIASQDGPRASEIMRREYVRKAARVVTEYKKRAAANRAAEKSAASEAEPAESVPDVTPAVVKTQGMQKKTDSQPAGTEKAVGLSGQGRLGDRLPLLCLASFSGTLSVGMLAYFGRAALSQSRRQREVALLNDPAPV